MSTADKAWIATPFASESANAPEHGLPETLDMERIGADQQRLEVVFDHLPHGAAGCGHAETFNALVGFDVHEAMTAGAHVRGRGVGDGAAARDGHQRRAHLR